MVYNLSQTNRKMKKITLNVDESKLQDFLRFIEALDYVSILDETEVFEAQQLEAIKRMELIEKGEMKIRSWEEAKQNIFNS